MQFPTVLTIPKPYGIQVEWQWPEGSGQHSYLEIQFLSSGGELKKRILGWPCEGMTIGGLKAGERLQIRLRPIDKNGAGRDWTNSDWIEGVSSSNPGDYLDAITCGSDTPSASGVDSNIEAILKNALAHEKAMSELSEIVREAIQKECRPGGLIWHQRGF